MSDHSKPEAVTVSGAAGEKGIGVKCTERKVRLSGEEVSYECELLALEGGVAVVRYVIEEERSVDGVRLPAGTVTLGLYYADRPYNLYYWIAPRDSERAAGVGDTAHRSVAAEVWSRDIAYYFNIAEPLELSRETIAYRDLVVDVLVLPDGSARVLDEDELPEPLDARLRDRIEAVRNEILSERARILTDARKRLLPFAQEL